MAEDGGNQGGVAITAPANDIAPKKLTQDSRNPSLTKSGFEFGTTSFATTPIGSRRNSVQMEDYFVGPRDLDRHSKLPYFLRMHGSVLPQMILPLTFAGGWATLVTCISEFVFDLGISNTLLTVLGFVVGLALSFRSSTAYERYSDGRKSWTVVSVQCRNLARYIWVHTIEREGELGKQDLLAKVTSINMILAFAVSLKHKLRFEPYAHYPDIHSLVSHLDTFAMAAHKDSNLIEPKKNVFKKVGEYLGITFASSNPRKVLKRAEAPLGNLPLEILTYLGSYIEEINSNGTLKQAVVSSQMLVCLASLTDAQAQAERVLTTPLPIGYNILISQIVILYIYILPFQLYTALGWITIPGVLAAAYIIMGLAAIGNELENPFGNDVNDLPLDTYCKELSQELDVLMSVKAPQFSDFLNTSSNNQVLWPLSSSGYNEWKERSEEDIRSALRAKVFAAKASYSTASAPPQSKNGTFRAGTATTEKTGGPSLRENVAMRV
ncbi:hypothetical protein HYFRA_00003220 [Hymenoscyphus fraxineus]|uniref:Uncharacterized protein n=1 Tax=Hymenoscyphus fraxineus TaxID=746836 RepID=A0A9N9KW10_9HELO|nr:hypothetical protein HYFRA_00003220 [Hymenoscyphus fraxineus]